jgi:hypothetical protein
MVIALPVVRGVDLIAIVAVNGLVLTRELGDAPIRHLPRRYPERQRRREDVPMVRRRRWSGLSRLRK